MMWDLAYTNNPLTDQMNIELFIYNTQRHTPMYRITGTNSFYSFLKLSPHVTGSLAWWILLKIIFSHQILFPSKSYFDCDALNLRWWKLDFWQINSSGMSWKHHEWWNPVRHKHILSFNSGDIKGKFLKRSNLWPFC